MNSATVLAGSSETPLWLHHPQRATGAPHSERDDLPPAAVAAINADETEPRFTRFDGADVLILRGVNLNENRRPEDMVSLRVAVTEDRIESVALQRVRAVEDTAELARAAGAAARPGMIVTHLVANLTSRVKDSLVHLNHQLADLEDILEAPGPNPSAQELSQLRRQAIWLHRFSVPQADALEAVLAAEPAWLKASDLIDLREHWHATRRNVAALEAIRDHSRLIQDRIDQATAEASQRATYILTIIAGIFLPLNLVAALLGANVGGVPWSGDGNGFTYLLAGSAVLTVVQLLILRRLKWI
ncbi:MULTISPECIES: CorA family divalent cation transporter [unclassified Minwuia]|jgi:zinc transporter|uniref:CorA family divalent cation transporter n=1 Tax=unclassified Minwuia TaxID=2618799 RepID=UPI002479A559|nr:MULTISPECIES: CorA family divalent cation transporter [unclassified Minwuia]